MFVTKAMRVFIVLYQEKNLKSAAERLCLTVPPVSRMLKLTEEWLGEQLFITERNNLIPTPAADCTYQRIYPYFSALEQFRFNKECGFRISSPLIDSSVMPNLLSLCPTTIADSTIVRNAGSMHPDDDIFISMMPSVQLPEFDLFRTDMVLELHCIESLGERWRDTPLLSEQCVDQLPQFKQVLQDMYTCGHSGKVRRIDNPVWLNQAFERGEGLSFRRPDNIGEQIRALPFIIHLPLYIYINERKRDSRHEQILTNIKNEMH